MGTDCVAVVRVPIWGLTAVGKSTRPKGSKLEDYWQTGYRRYRVVTFPHPKTGACKVNRIGVKVLGYMNKRNKGGNELAGVNDPGLISTSPSGSECELVQWVSGISSELSVVVGYCSAQRDLTRSRATRVFRWRRRHRRSRPCCVLVTQWRRLLRSNTGATSTDGDGTTRRVFRRRLSERSARRVLARCQ